MHMQCYQDKRVKAEDRFGPITGFLLFGHICIMQRMQRVRARTPELQLELKTLHLQQYCFTSSLGNPGDRKVLLLTHVQCLQNISYKLCLWGITTSSLTVRYLCPSCHHRHRFSSYRYTTRICTSTLCSPLIKTKKKSLCWLGTLKKSPLSTVKPWRMHQK